MEWINGRLLRLHTISKSRCYRNCFSSSSKIPLILLSVFEIVYDVLCMILEARTALKKGESSKSCASYQTFISV